MPGSIALEQLLSTPELAALGPERRPGVQSQAQLDQQLQPILAGSALTAERQDLIRALVLLWHDHLDAAHHIAQEIETADGAFVHGIMHRREPDFGNAAYWFRRVGRHDALGAIASRAEPLLGRSTQRALGATLIHNRTWDPFAFMTACEQASSWPESERALLREIQKEEFGALLECFQKP